VVVSGCVASQYQRISCTKRVTRGSARNGWVEGVL
jgi:hypothetical protein